MADLTHIQLPDNTTYSLKDASQTRSDHRHYEEDIVPILHKTYESTSYYATVNDYANASWYFMSIKPDDWYKPWRVKFKVHSYCPSYASYQSYTWSTICGRQNGLIYANWNERGNSAHSYITAYSLTAAGFNAGYGHAIAISIYAADNGTSSSYYRTFEVDYYGCENCTVEFLDTPVKWTSWPGTGTTNYGSIAAYDAITRGLCETNDANTNTIGEYAGTIVAGPGNIAQYSLVMQTQLNPPTFTSLVTTSSTAATKVLNSCGFLPNGKVLYMSGTTVAAGAKAGQASVWVSISAIDLRYSFNISTTTFPDGIQGSSVYIKCTLNSEDKKLYPVSPTWWATELPTTNDGYYYVFVGQLYSRYQATFYPYHPIYYHDGTEIKTYVPKELSPSADKIDYDNTTSGLTADNVQDAIDELSADSSDTKVTQTPTTTSANYEVIFSGSANNTETTEEVRKNSNLTFNPSTGNLQATQLNGITIGSSPKFTDTTYTGTGAISVDSSTHVISTTAEVNQNAFSNVKVGSTTVAADSKTDTLELVAGSNITLTPDATYDKVTIAATDTNTTYTFADGTNGFTVTPSGGTAQTVTVTPSITNNITGSGTTNKVAKFTGTNTIGDGYSVDSTVTSESANLITSGAVASAINALDGTITGSAGASKTLTAFSQTDGKVSAAFGDINITKSQISDFPTLGTAAAKDVPASGNASTTQVVMGNDTRLSDARPASNVTNTYSAIGTAPVSGTAVAAALGTLDGSITGSPAASKTLTAFSETDGKVSATFAAISITKSQISDFPTIPTVNNATLTIQKNGNTVETFTANASSDVTANITVPTSAADVGAIATTAKGAAGGVAELDANGLVPTSQLPSYVDDVLEYASASAFPATGASGKIYVALDTNLTYRWGGTEYVEISPSLALGEDDHTAYRGDRGKIAYDHSRLSSGNPHNVTKTDVGLGNVGNFKAVSTVASQGLTDTEKSNARANIGVSTTSVGSASAGTEIPADDITEWTTNTPTEVTKKTVVTSATFNEVVTGGSTTDIPNISKKTVVTSASGATASYADGVLTITDGSFGTGDSVTVGTAISAYTSLTTGASGSAQTGDSVTVTPGTAASLSYTAKSIPNISVTTKTVATATTT